MRESFVYDDGAVYRDREKVIIADGGQDYCSICGDTGSLLFVEIVKEDGVLGTYICFNCRDDLVCGDKCCICGGSTGERYRVALEKEDWNTRNYPLCFDCRKAWYFEEDTALRSRLNRLGVDRFGGRE